MRRRQFAQTVIAAAALGLAATARAGAASVMPLPFSQDAFAAAQGAGKPILVDVWASWCPICARQAPTLAKLAVDPAFRDLVVLRVNFDTQKDVLRAFGVRVQSTLIVFHGTTETARAVGETDPDAIRALLASGLG